MSYQLTQKIAKALKGRHTDAVESEFEGMLADGTINWRKDLKIHAALEHDFGMSYRDKLQSISDDAMEAIITSGTFHKMVSTVIRHVLNETPKEAYKLSAAVNSETVGECDGPIQDDGIFTDFQAHEVCELEAPPLYGVASDFLRHPTGKDAGLGIAFTRDALCKDPSGMIQRLIPKLRDALDEYRENKLIDTFIGYLPTFNRSGTSYNTYYGADNTVTTPFLDGTNGPWINAACNDFLCSSDLDVVKELGWNMRDMFHGRELNLEFDEVWTSKQKADHIRPLLLASAVECDTPCAGEGQTCKYIMTAEVANGMTFSVTPYTRLIDRIVLRYGVTQAEAQEWWWIGRVNDFLTWAWQRQPSVTRCPLGPMECQKRIAAIYTSNTKGYAFIKNPQAGIMLMPCGSASFP